jgi:hypothetical protein
LGEVTGDGYKDLGIGDLDADGFDPFTGTVQRIGKTVIYPGAASISGYINFDNIGTSIVGIGRDDKCGHSLNSAGDIDDDQVDDFVIGCHSYSGGSRLFYGPISTGSYDIDDASARFDVYNVYGAGGHGASNRAEPVGDVNADNYGDFLIGRTGKQADGVALFLGLAN